MTQPNSGKTVRFGEGFSDVYRCGGQQESWPIWRKSVILPACGHHPRDRSCWRKRQGAVGGKRAPLAGQSGGHHEKSPAGSPTGLVSQLSGTSAGQLASTLSTT